MARDELDMLLTAAKRLAAIILENGGETYRAEEAVHRLCGLCATEEVAVLALPTGVLIHMTTQNGETRSALVRVRTRRLDLGAVARANNIARGLSCGTLSVEAALGALVPAQSPHKVYQWIAEPAWSAVAVGCFSVLLGGGIYAFFAAMICAFLSQMACVFFKNEDMFYFVTSFIGGVVCALTAVLLTILFHAGSPGIVISAAILPLLPGMMLINAIRDAVRGDLVSGAARLGDVAVVSLSLAFGIGAVLWLYVLAGGVL